MKKTLLALAAIAASSAAMAQSTVTLYGVLDASVESVKGDKTVTRLSSGNLATSRLGVKGTEDLGDGLAAKFNLESGLFVDTGAQNQTSRFWSRQAWVGLSSKTGGELRLGRTLSPIGDVAVGLGEAQPYDELKVSGARAVGAYQYVDNAVTYLLPVFVPGLSAQLQYSTATGSSKIDTAGTPGAEAAGSSLGKGFGLNVRYAAGPLSAGLAYQYLKDEYTATATDSGTKANATLLYVGYDLGVAKVTGYYDAETNLAINNPATSVNTRRSTVTGIKTAVPVSPEFTVVAAVAEARNLKGTVTGGANGDNAQIVSLKGLYTLSKRTTVYGLVTNVNNGSAVNKSVDNSKPNNVAALAVTNGKTDHGIAVGVSHAF